MQRRMTLTAELVARVHRVEPDEGPREHQQQMDDADYRSYSHSLRDAMGNPPVRVFAYGSLIWKPEFEFTRQRRATLHGWHRAFCMKIERWRGTRAQPGLMMALDRGGCCNGVLYDLPEGDGAAQIERILRREMTNKPPTNTPRIVNVAVAGQGVEKALVFTPARSGASYTGKLPLQDVAKVLARAAGHWGSGAEYLFNTVSHLNELGITDRNLWRLQQLVAEEISRNG